MIFANCILPINNVPYILYLLFIRFADFAGGWPFGAGADTARMQVVLVSDGVATAQVQHIF